MHVVADTQKLVADGIITPQTATELEIRGRDTMVQLAINMVLCFGIISATLGLIFWLADAVTVAVVGLGLLAGGLALLVRATTSLRMFGNAAALIGSGMLMGGAALELVDKYTDIAGPIMAAGGILVALIAGRAVLKGGLTAPFIAGAILVMGISMHLFGAGFWANQNDVTGILKALFYFYAALMIAGIGVTVDVRLITALAIVPFAQMLDTGTGYFHAAYVFYSPESTLSTLQLGVLMGIVFWLMRGQAERALRHGRIILVMAFIIANLCALVGSLWGDVIGESIWGPTSWWRSRDVYADYQAWSAARSAFRETAMTISANVYSIVWAIALAAMIFWFAHKGNRGLFNTAVTFAAIHAYTQMFESFGDEPLAFVIGGFAAIPLAWIMWRLNQGLLRKGANP